MKRLPNTLLAMLLAALSASAAEPVAERSVLDGVYTVSQADAGEVLYVQHCLSCHAQTPGAVTGHGPAPSIVGESFLFRWQDAAVADLFDTIRQTMPEAAPNSLSAQEYMSLTAYLLALNGYPSGQEPLSVSRRAELLETYIEIQAQ